MACGPRLAEDLLGRALAHVDLVELDGRVRPRAPVDADDLVAFANEPRGEQASHGAGGPGNEHPHAEPPCLAATTLRSAVDSMRAIVSFTSST